MTALNESDTVPVLEHQRKRELVVLYESGGLWENSAGHCKGSSGERREEPGP